jgi:hypothetical protein
VNWGRGFFRAWLVLSVLWIGLNVYLNGPKTYTVKSVYEAQYLDKSVAGLPSSS